MKDLAADEAQAAKGDEVADGDKTIEFEKREA